MDDLIIGAAMLLVLGAAVPFLVFWQGRYSSPAVLRKRVAALATRKSNRNEAAEATAANKSRQKLIQGKLKDMERSRSMSKRNTLRHLLLQSGSGLTVSTYMGLSALSGAMCFLLAMMVNPKPLVWVVAAVGGVLAVPRFFLRKAIAKRQRTFTGFFADALDILVRGTRTGLPVGECLRIVGREVPDPVGFEFRMLVESQRIGMSLEQALEKGLERMPTTEFQFFAIVLVVQQQTGGNLAGTLDNLSLVLRSRRKLKDKIQAMSSEAKASAMIIGSLPFVVGLLLYLVNPQYISLLFTTKAGNNIITVGSIIMVMGVLVMRAMINFKF